MVMVFGAMLFESVLVAFNFNTLEIPQ